MPLPSRACTEPRISQANFAPPTAIATRRWLRAAATGAAILALAACGKSAPDLKAQFAAQIPPSWQVESFKVEVEDDVGTKVEPQRHYRFRAEVSPKADLYQGLGTLEGHAILRRVAKKGDDTPVLGTARSRFHADQWETVFSREQGPNFMIGKPADAFGAQHAVIGDASFKRLAATAQASLEQRAAQIADDETRRQALLAEWNTLNQKAQEENRQAADTLNREQQRIFQAQTALRTQARQEGQAAEQQMQALLKERSTGPRQELDARVAALDKDYRLKSAELQAQGKELQQALSGQRKQLRDAYSADISAARQRLNAADLTRYRAAAEETLRARQSELDTAARERQTQLRAQESALSNQRREQVAQANSAYQEQVGAIRQEIDATRSANRDGISQKTNAEIEALNAALQTARQAQQAAVRASNEPLAAKRREAELLAAKIQQTRREDMQLRQLLDQLATVQP